VEGLLGAGEEKPGTTKALKDFSRIIPFPLFAFFLLDLPKHKKKTRLHTIALQDNYATCMLYFNKMS
jgi:hypothetical protein